MKSFYSLLSCTKATTVIVMIFVFFLLGFSGVKAAEPLDLRAALTALYDNSKEQGNLHDVPKGLIQGNLYSRGYKLAERNLSKSTIEGIDRSYEYLKETCDGNISVQQVTTVFQNTDEGRTLYALLERRGMAASLDDGKFADACIQVYLCATNTTALSKEDRKRLYTLNIYEQCQNTVSSIYQSVVARGKQLSSLEDTNYGDDIFANRKEEDAPYDLLYDIERIGNMMYVHNDPATEIQFYDLESLDSYQQDSPLQEKDYLEKKPEPTPQNPLAHLPLSNGITPAIPDLSYLEALDTRNQAFKPSTSKSPQGRSNQGFPTPISMGGQNQTLPSPGGIQGGVLGNNICEVAIEPEEAPRDLLKDAEDQQKETYNYGKDLDLKERVALDIMKGLMPPQEEEKAASERGGIEPGGNDLGASVVDEMNIDSDGQSLSDVKDALQNCLEESGLDKNQWRKEIIKKAGEAVKLSQCVQNILCKGLHDPSNKGMYTIKFCKIPSKRYNVVANMPVHSVEEVMNELRNVCVNLKDSGELIKHQQTKDGIFSTQLPKLNLKKMFSFEIAFTTKPTRAEKDVRTEKIEEEQKNKYLQKTVLNITDSLTHESQRNKYIIVANPFESKAQTEQGSLLALDQERLRKSEAFYSSLKASDAKQQDVLAQKKLMAQTQDSYEQFLDQQTQFRDMIYGQLNDLNKKRKAKNDEFQHAKK